MPNSPKVPRDPSDNTRGRRVAAAVQELLNSLIERGDIVRAALVNKWKLKNPAPADLPGGSAPPVWFGDSGDGVEGPMGPVGPPGPAGATGATGPSGSGGGVSVFPGWFEESDPTSFFLPPGSSSAATGGAGSGSAATGGWDHILTAASDEGVTNSTTLVDHSTLKWNVTAGSSWRIAMYGYYKASLNTNDYKINFHASAGAMTGVVRYVSSHGTSDAIQASQQRATGGTDLTVHPAFGAASSEAVRSFLLDGLFDFTADCVFSLQHAQNAAGVGQTSWTAAGTKLYGQRVL